ncbi:hypothetical protein DEI91_00730 [Curtobacterium sp. MCBD17_032]|nr:hypothetical protein DEI89_12630 [Curtobacterium sp. MCBD17_030]PZE86866.1 hypothetical protein DEI91_00730 [Curtobacterium sp. MCBD17_032]
MNVHGRRLLGSRLIGDRHPVRHVAKEERSPPASRRPVAARWRSALGALRTGPQPRRRSTHPA